MQQPKLQSVTVVITALVLDVLADAPAVLNMKREKQFASPTFKDLISINKNCHNTHNSQNSYTMSLYTITSLEILPTIKKPAGLRIEESTDVTLLAKMGEIAEEEVVKRLANNHSAFIAYIHNQPAAFGWMARSKATIGELNHTLILPAGNRYLWNFRTLIAYRGLSIYPALLQYIIRYEANKAHQFWIIHAPENKSSLNGIVKAGFEYTGKLYTNTNGTTMLEANDLGETYRNILESMQIQLSTDTPASCWNCSSPYLKKRKPECCCSTAGSECTNNAMLSIAS